MTTSNINKKFNELLHKELDGFFETLFDKAEETEFTKENLVQLAKEYFPLEKVKKTKEKKERKIPDDTERCIVEKKDGSRCNGSKNKKEEYFDTEYANMCPLHINSAKKAKVIIPEEETFVDEIEKPEETVLEEIEKPEETNEIEKPVKPKKKKASKKEVISEDEL